MSKYEPLTPDNVKDFPNFNYEDFACHCNGKYCDGFPVDFSYELARILQMIRNHFNSPLIITSPIRCEVWNKKQGGVSNSRHKWGWACDFYVKGVSYNQLRDYVKTLPFVHYYYNVSSSVMHLDIDAPDEDLIIKPVSRDKTKNQLKVLVVNLQVRRGPSLSSDVRGYVKTNAIYNYYGVKQSDGYTWYQIDDIQWIPSNGSWLEIYPKEEQPSIDKELEEAQKTIKELSAKNEELKIEIENLKKDLNDFEQVFTSEEDKTYKFQIKMYKGESLYIK